MFLDKLLDDLLGGKETSITAFRAGDKENTGYWDEFYRLIHFFNSSVPLGE